MNKIHTRKDMDEKLTQGCQEPGCKHEHEKMSELFVNPGCHPGMGVDACYNAEGILIFTCHYCDRHIVTIKVGEEEEDGDTNAEGPLPQVREGV